MADNQEKDNVVKLDSEIKSFSVVDKDKEKQEKIKKEASLRSKPALGLSTECQN